MKASEKLLGLALDDIPEDMSNREYWLKTEIYEIGNDVAKLEDKNAWMRREIERVGHAIFTGEKGYIGTEEDLQAIGQFVEGMCETLERQIKLEAVSEAWDEAVNLCALIPLLERMESYFGKMGVHSPAGAHYATLGSLLHQLRNMRERYKTLTALKANAKPL